MHKQKVLCNGEATGKQCKHYWGLIRIVDSHDAEFLVNGEKLRFCRAWGAEPLEFGEGRSEQAVHCTLYEPSERPYDKLLEEYTPLSEEQVEDLKASEETPSAEDTDTEPGFKKLNVDDVLGEDNE